MPALHLTLGINSWREASSVPADSFSASDGFDPDAIKQMRRAFRRVLNWLTAAGKPPNRITGLQQRPGVSSMVPFRGLEQFLVPTFDDYAPPLLTS